MEHGQAANSPALVVRTILIVDDEADIRDSLQGLFEEEVPNVRVMVAPDAKAALQILSEEHVDLILTDFRMPGMDGLALLGRAHEVAPGAQSVLMTAYADPDVRSRAFNEAHVRHFLEKPLDLEGTLNVVAEALAAA